MLHHEPPAFRCPHCVRIAQLEVVAQEQGGYQFRHLHPADVATETHPGTGTEGEEEPMHVSIVLCEPSLGSESVDILTVDFLVLVDDPWIGSNDGSCWNILSSDLEASFRDYSGQAHAYRWMESFNR